MKKKASPVFNKLIANRVAIVSLLVLTTLVGVSFISQQVSADRYDDQKAAIQREIEKYNQEALKYAKEAKSFEEAKAKLSAEKKVLIGQINLSKNKKNHLEKQIKDSQVKIEKNQEALGDIITSIYINSDTTPLEMLASSDNIGDYIDKQEYRSSIRGSLSDTIDQIKSLKQKLENDKAEVEKVIAREESQRKALAEKEAEQARLARASRSKQSSYNGLANSGKNRLQKVAAQQRAYYERLRREAARKNQNGISSGVSGAFAYRNWGGNLGCSGGYPYCAGPLDYGIDEWQLYYRECVSYAAWRIEYGYGKQVNPFNGQGNAGQWVYSAPAYSNAWRVYDPKPGDAVVLPVVPGFAPVGHLMVVESNLGNGWVRVSQYNFFGTGEYSTMDIRTTGVVFLRFPNK